MLSYHQLKIADFYNISIGNVKNLVPNFFDKEKYVLLSENVQLYLKVVSATYLLVCFLSLNNSTCQTRKNVFYFTSKALFVLKFHDVIKCLSIKEEIHFTE